jgi:hypothetical protein
VAEEEYYRVKLVMELHDRTQAALSRMRAGSKRVESAFARARQVAQAFGRTVVSPTVSIKDKATTGLQLVRSAAKSLTGTAWRLTLTVWDRATSFLDRIRRSLFSLKGLAVTVLAGLGLGRLGQATLGAAATWETQAVSMEHWLGGNKAAAAQVTAWLERFAAATPFEMSDLFPAMSRAIGITGGNVAVSQRLVKLAADMAGLTPGKTVLDAMEALADAQMGEFERLREFQMKMTQEQMKALGGFEGFLLAAEGRFAGGAAKLAGTSVGLISTITDNIKNLFRAAGTGMLEAIKPRLQKVVDWFGQNERTVTRWRNTLADMGRQAADKILSWLEGAFRYLDTHYFSNPEFQKLDLGGKIKFAWDDLKASFDNWWDNEGGEKTVTDLGTKIGGALVKGAWLGLLGLGDLALGATKKAVTEPSAGNIGLAFFTDVVALGLLNKLTGGLLGKGLKWLLGLGGAAAATGGGAAAAAGGAGAAGVAGGAGAAGTAASLFSNVLPFARMATLAGALQVLVNRAFAPYLSKYAEKTRLTPDEAASARWGAMLYGYISGVPSQGPGGGLAGFPLAYGITAPSVSVTVQVDSRAADAESMAEEVGRIVAGHVVRVLENAPVPAR